MNILYQLHFLFLALLALVVGGLVWLARVYDRG
jgi:hypothetical protein